MDLIPPLRILSPCTGDVTEGAREAWIAIRTFEVKTPDAFLLHFLSFVFLNSLRPSVAYLVNLSIYWRPMKFLWWALWNQYLEKVLFQMKKGHNVEKVLISCKAKQSKHFPLILVHSQVWKCQKIFNESLCAVFH